MTYVDEEVCCAVEFVAQDVEVKVEEVEELNVVAVDEEVVE